jgi:hypothetical protein
MRVSTSIMAATAMAMTCHSTPLDASSAYAEIEAASRNALEEATHLVMSDTATQVALLQLIDKVNSGRHIFNKTELIQEVQAYRAVTEDAFRKIDEWIAAEDTPNQVVSNVDTDKALQKRAAKGLPVIMAILGAVAAVGTIASAIAVPIVISQEHKYAAESKAIQQIMVWNELNNKKNEGKRSLVPKVHSRVGRK